MFRPSFRWTLPLAAALALGLSACDDRVTVPEALIWAPEQISATIDDSITVYGVYLGDGTDLARFSWDLTSDGIFDYTFESQGWDLDTLGIDVAYTHPGDYVVTLQATTVTNNLYRTTTTVRITDRLPQVDTDVPSLMTCGETALVSARVIDDAGFRVWWDLDANGSPDTIIGFTDTVELASPFSPTGPGVRRLSFVALDNDDHRIEENFEVEVGLEPVWTPLEDSPAAMEEGRWAHASALHQGKIYVFGGRNRVDVLDSVEIYDPDADGWTAGAPMPTPRWLARAFSYGDSIYVVGGYELNGSIHMRIDAYDPIGDAWAAYDPADTTKTLPQARIGFGLDERRHLSEDGYMLLFGGFSAGEAQGFSMKYKFQPGTWTHDFSNEMKSPRRDFGFAEVSGLSFAAGGSEDGAQPSAAFERYDPGPKVWVRLSDLPTARRHPAMAAWGEHLYAFGGETTEADASNLLEIYDLQTRNWSTGPPMPQALAAASAHAIDGVLYVIGGHVPDSNLGEVRVWTLTPWRCAD